MRRALHNRADTKRQRETISFFVARCGTFFALVGMVASRNPKRRNLMQPRVTAPLAQQTPDFIQ